MLEQQLVDREQELDKLKSKTTDEAKIKGREELQRAVAVLKHVKKRAGAGMYDAEFQSIMEEIRYLENEDHI